MDWASGLDIPKINAGLEYNLFTCCTEAYGINGSGSKRKTTRILPKILSDAGVSLGTLQNEERCCGDPAGSLGDTKYFTKAVDQNTRLFLERGIKKILTTSPHCYNAFKKYYPELDGCVGIEHYTQLLDRLLLSEKIRPEGKIDKVVTFHDPCYLGRHNGIYDAPRRILKAIPGLTVVEMPNNRENSLCCGGGGGHAWKEDSPLSRLRVQEALTTGAQVIATACPFCTYMLNRGVQAMGQEIQVAELSTLLNQSLGAEENFRDNIDGTKSQSGPAPLHQEVSHD